MGEKSKIVDVARAHVIDIALVLLAFAFGAVSLTYPFGRDQALYAYVGREWAERGAIPYRDVFDHKTPAIYVLHALATILFGDTQWGIRVFDLLAVGALGAVVARFIAPRGTSVPTGLRGVAILVASLLYYGFFDYWNTAQTELWYGMLGLASITAATRIVKDSRAQLIAGILGGAAMVMKPPAIGFVAIAALLVLLRARADRADFRRVFVAVLRFGVGFAIPIALVFLYFGAHHALSAMADIVVGANGYYVAHERGVQSVAEALVKTKEYCAIFASILLFVVVGLAIEIALSVKRHEASRLRARYGIPAAVCFCGYFAIAMQQKFYWLHASVMVTPLCLLVTTITDDLIRRLTGKIGRLRATVLASVAPLIFYFLPFSAAPWPASHELWTETVKLAYRYRTGAISRSDYASTFNITEVDFHYRDVDDASRYIAEHSTPDDAICVRGFNPEIYILAHRRYGGRFFWSTFLVDPHRAYRREAYLAEDREAFARVKPRLVVTLTVASGSGSIDASEYYEPLGYEVTATFGKLVVMQRTEH